jgi:hypothetical protein
MVYACQKAVQSSLTITFAGGVSPGASGTQL